MTIFEKIAAHEIPARIVCETEDFLAFHDVQPQAPVHILIVPKRALPRIGEAQPGDADLLGRMLLAAPGIRVGMVTRNVTHEPEVTLGKLFARHGVDIRQLDFLHYVPLREEKAPYFITARERFDINPARAYACGDEHKDYVAAQSAGMHPFIVSYGFESFARLTRKFSIPEAIISPTPPVLCDRVRHALDLPAA